MVWLKFLVGRGQGLRARWRSWREYRRFVYASQWGRAGEAKIQAKRDDRRRQPFPQDCPSASHELIPCPSTFSEPSFGLDSCHPTTLKSWHWPESMIKSVVIIVGVAGGLITAILGGFIAVLEFRDKDTDLAAILAATSAPTTPAIVQYLSPQATQPPADPAPAPATN